MPTYSTDTEPPIESDLLDLSTISFAALRTLNDPTLEGAVRRAVHRAGRVRPTSRSNTQQAGGERID